MPTQDLFIRKVKLQAGGTSYDGFRITFDVDKRLDGTKPQSTTIQIYNLSPTSRANLQQPATSIVLSAGYESNIATIFTGTTRTVSHVKEKADWITKITAADGIEKIRTNRAALSFKANTPFTTVIQQMAKATGLDGGNLTQKLGQFAGGLSSFSNGFSGSGPAFPMLRKFLGTMGYDVSVRDGALTVLKATAPGVPLDVTSDPVVVVSQQSGMIGSPEIAEEGDDKRKVLKVKALIDPRFKIGGQIQLKSQNLSGFYRVERVNFKGDNFGQEWAAEMECKL